MSFQNVISGNGINISVTGMVIVFCGLLLISVFIWLLPKILNFFVDVQDKKNGTLKPQVSAVHPEVEKDDTDELDIVSIIGLVLFMEQERLGGNPSVIRNLNIWGSAGKTTIMPRRRVSV